MDKIKLIADLNEIIQKRNLKKSEVEEKLKFPKNGLSNFLSGKKELPDKWVNPFQSYIDCFNPDYVPAPVKVEPEQQAKNSFEWVDEIEKFCNDNNCVPDDLMKAYTDFKLGSKVPTEKDKEWANKKIKEQKSEVKDLTPQNNPNSNWFSDYRKKKLGL